MKKDEEIAPIVSIAKSVKVCQNCRSQVNNPSRCRTHHKFVGRKEEGCEQFK